MIFFLICQRVWKTVKCQGKIREKSGNFEVSDNTIKVKNKNFFFFLFWKSVKYQGKVREFLSG